MYSKKKYMQIAGYTGKSRAGKCGNTKTPYRNTEIPKHRDRNTAIHSEHCHPLLEIPFRNIETLPSTLPSTFDYSGNTFARNTETLPSISKHCHPSQNTISKHRNTAIHFETLSGNTARNTETLPSISKHCHPFGNTVWKHRNTAIHILSSTTATEVLFFRPAKIFQIRLTSNSCNFLTTEPISKFLVLTVSDSS